MKSDTEVRIRKLRKILRQIENLERLDRTLCPAEEQKVSNKSDVRSELLELLSSCPTEGSTSYQTTSLTLQSQSEFDSRDLDVFDDEDYSRDEDDLDAYEHDKHGISLLQQPQSTNSKPYNGQHTEAITDGEKTTGQQNLNTPENLGEDHTAISSSTTDVSPAKKPRTAESSQTAAVRPKSEQTGKRAPSKNEQKGDHRTKSNPHKQLQKKWATSRWKVARLDGHNDLVCSVSVCGKWLLTGSRDTTVKLWDMISHTEVRSMGGHTGGVTSVVLLGSEQSRAVVQALSLDHPPTASMPSLGLSASSDCSIRVWDLDTGHMLKSFYAFSPVTRLAFTLRDGKARLLSGSAGGKVELWSLDADAAIQSIRAYDAPVTGLVTCQDYVYSSSAEGELQVFQFRDSSLHTVFISENVKLTSGAQLLWRHVRCLAAVDQTMYYGDDAMNLKVVDWKEGVAHKLSNHTTEFGTTDALGISHDCDLLLSSGYDLDNGLGFVNVRQLSSEKYLCSLCDDATSRIVAIDCCPTRPDNSGITMVTAGMELTLWTQIVKEINPTDPKSSTSAQFVPHFTRPPHHSDMESESETELSLEEDEDEEGLAQEGNIISPPFNPKPSGDHDNKGWLSWCVLL